MARGGAIRIETAGESHGPGIVAIVTGLPRGVTIDERSLAERLDRRRRGYGRSARQRMETDAVEWLAGVRGGATTGAPVAFRVPNAEDRLERMPPIRRPRPGHADLAGMLRWGIRDARDVLERASARETVARVVAGELAQALLTAAGMEAAGFVRAIGGVEATSIPDDLATLREARDASVVLCPDASATDAMVARIDEAKAAGDSLGGIVEVRVFDPLPGMGSHARAGEKLDARLLGALGAVHAVKGAEVGLGFGAAAVPGSEAHDAIVREGDGLARSTNRAGGIEGGMTNGETIVVRAAMKPLPTIMKPLPSVDMRTGEADAGHVERADVCAVSALSVIAESVVALEVASALLERTAGTTVDEVVERVATIRERTSRLF
jgi:chorismate synthase